MHSKLLIFLYGAVLALPGGTSFAGSLHGDAGVTSDYVWRGLTQTDGGPAVSGGLEYVSDSAWYVGTWVSNTSQGENGVNSAEVDYYTGLSGQGKNLGYDIGYIAYTYPQSSGLNFRELYFAFMAKGLMLKYSESSDAGTYLEGAITHKFGGKRPMSLTVHAGSYNRKNASNYTDGSIRLRIKEFSLTFSKTDLKTAQDKDLKTYVSWEYSF